MKYELALKIERAGFPYKNKNRVLVGDDGFNGDIALVPTLSELIAACGEDFVWLRRDADGGWSGIGGNENWLEGSCHQLGTTPEEAVANLWLALNHVAE